MSIVKLNNRGVRSVTAFGSLSSGSITFISKSTASSSATVDFTSGIDSTYKEYLFTFKNIHPATDGAFFTFQSDTGTNTNYNQTITSTHFQARHDEGDSDTSLAYNTGNDQAQGTSFHKLSNTIGNDNDQSLSGFCHVFNPSSSVFVKHFISNIQHSQDANFSFNVYTAGYFNTTTAITRFQFKMSSGNIDSGQILLFGLN